MKRIVLLSVLSLAASTFALAADKDDGSDISEHPFKGLELRGIGPAITSGRISDFEESYDIAAREFAVELQDLQAVSRDLDALETRLESLGAPWTPGRVPSASEISR